MDLTMAHGTRVFRMAERPAKQYITDGDGRLYVVQKAYEKGDGYEVLCREATRIERRLYERDEAAGRN